MTGAFRVPESFSAFLPVRIPPTTAMLLARAPAWTSTVGLLRLLGSDPAEARAVSEELPVKGAASPSAAVSPLGRALAPALRLYRAVDSAAAPSVEALSYPLTAARAACRLRRDGLAQAMLDAAVTGSADAAAATLASCWPGDDDGADVRILVGGASRLAEQRIYEATSAGRALRVAFPRAATIRVLLVGPEVDDAAYATSSSGEQAFGSLWREAGWRAGHGEMPGSGGAPRVLMSAVRSSVEAVLAPGAGPVASFLRDGPLGGAAGRARVIRMGVVHHGGFGNRWEAVRRGWAGGLAALAAWGEPVVFTCANRVEAIRGELRVHTRLLGARVLGAGMCPSRALTLVSGDPNAEMRRLGLPSREAIVAASLDCSIANFFVYAVQGLEAPPGADARSAAALDARSAAVRRMACRVAVKAGLAAVSVGTGEGGRVEATLAPAGDAGSAAGSALHVAAPWPELLPPGAELPSDLSSKAQATGLAAVPAEAVIAAVRGGLDRAERLLSLGTAGWAGRAVHAQAAELSAAMRADAPTEGVAELCGPPGWSTSLAAVGTTRVALQSAVVRAGARALDVAALAKAMAALTVREGLD